MSHLEIEFIEKYDSYNNGFNLTKGGEGGYGITWTEERKRKSSELLSCDRNPMSKISKKDFLEIVDMLKAGKSNTQIGDRFDIHNRYVSLIRHKRRLKKWWELVDDYEISESDSLRRSVNKEEFADIVCMIKNGETNASIERKYNLSAGTASRIRHKVFYKKWWGEIDKQQEPATTIETSSKDEME